MGGMTLVFYQTKSNMSDKHLLIESASEIRQLRKDNQVMAARLDMFDKMMALFNTPPHYAPLGMKEDVVYKLDKAIAEIEMYEAKQA